MVEILQAQESRLTRQEDFQMVMASYLGHLSAQIQGLHDHLAPPTPAAPPPTAAAAPV